MKIQNREDYINYRFHRAKESFDEALFLAENKKWNGVVNRLYYSCFYAVIALLLKNDIETKSHVGARSQFGLHFVKTGKIDIESGKFFSKIFDFRQKGDYGDLYDYDREIAEPLIENAKTFLEKIEGLMNNKN